MGLWRFRPGNRLLLVVFLLVLSATGGCRETPWTLWNAYAARFIDAQGRVIDPQGDARTTSEGQSYAMFFALADNDRATFDKLLSWTQSNLAQGDLASHLPAWLWGKNKDGSWKTIDPNSASDADAWMAYTLLEAGRLWANPAYTNLGGKMMAEIARAEVANLPGFGPMLLPGPAGFQQGNTSTLDPSYLPAFIFERFAAVDPAGPWRQIAQDIPRLIQQSSRHGFAMDWVAYSPGSGFYPVPTPGSGGAGTPVGSYDAIRVYLWAGMMSASDKARSQILSSIPGMGVYLADHDSPPEKVNDQGVPSTEDGPVGFSAALLPYLRAFPNLSKASARQTARMSQQRDPSTGLYGKAVAYYDQNLALFATGFMDGRFRFGPAGELNVEWKR